MGADVRPDMNGPAYADWLSDVLDALKLDEARLYAASWRSDRLAPSRESPAPNSKDVLADACGIVQGSVLPALLKLGWPMMRYKASPQRRYQYVRHLITIRDADWDILGFCVLQKCTDRRSHDLDYRSLNN
jgi:2-hydroxy-6-oxonona-2,4-dienedioate hydrolase